MTHVILLVDDLATNNLLLEKMLGGLDFRILKTNSGVRALEIVKEEPVSVVLLDVEMPEMDGFEVARRIRAEPATAGIPIIFATAGATDERSIAGGYEAGAIDYLFKPVDANILRRKVQILCALVEKERRIAEQYEEAEQRNRELEQLIERQRVLEEARMESELRYRALVALSPMAVVVQVDGGLVYYNAAAMQLLGLPKDEAQCPMPIHEFVHERDRDKVWRAVDAIARRGGRSDAITCQLRDGSFAELHAGGILYEDKVGVQMALLDITAHKQLESELRRLSQMDGLTGLMNRRTLNELLAEEWNRAGRSAQPVSVLMLDLDKFKPFNDHYGHLAGDECLRRVARVLSGAAARPGDIVARYGGEEFCVVLPNTHQEGAAHIADAIVDGVRKLKIRHSGNRNLGYASISCGIMTALPQHGGGQAEGAIQHADEALYAQKRKGGDGYTVSPASVSADLPA